MNTTFACVLTALRSTWSRLNKSPSYIQKKNYHDHPVLHKKHVRTMDPTLTHFLSQPAKTIPVSSLQASNHRHIAMILSQKPLYWVGENANEVRDAIYCRFAPDMVKSPDSAIFDEELAKRYNFLTPFFAGKDYNNMGLALTQQEKNNLYNQADTSLEKVDGIIITSSPKDVYVGVQVTQDILLARPRAIIRYAKVNNISVSKALEHSIFVPWIHNDLFTTPFDASFSNLGELIDHVEEKYGSDSGAMVSLIFKLVSVPVIDFSSLVASSFTPSHVTRSQNCIDKAVLNQHNTRVFSPQMFINTVSRLMREGIDVDTDLKLSIVVSQ